MEKETKDEGESRPEAVDMSDYLTRLRKSGRNRESYDEITELETELRRAYIAKELEVQLLERETERYIDNVRTKRAERVARQDQQEALEDEFRRKTRNMEKTDEYRKELMAQMQSKEASRNTMMEEARREREVLTEVDRIRDMCDRLKTLETKDELAQSGRRERLIVEEMKRINSQEDEEAAERKRLEDEEYLAEIEERVETARRVRHEQLMKRERMVAEIAGLLINREVESREREALLDELVAEDVRSELLAEVQEDAIRRNKAREELAASLEEQIAFNERCKLRFVEQDRAFAEQIMRKVMDDEKTCRLTADAKRRMQRQYREDLTRMMETRQRTREEGISSMLQTEREEEERRELVRADRVAECRKRLLMKHASNVANFLDRNLLTEEERRTFGLDETSAAEKARV